MASEKKGNVLGAFFDEGAYTPLFGGGEGAVVAAYGMAGGQPAYAVCQTGKPVAACDIEVMVKTAELAAKTGNPITTFYNASGVVIENGLEPLAATAKLNAATAKISGVVPQVAVVTGVCGASQAMAAANADVCIMAGDAQLFLSSPFLSAAAGEKVEGAGSAESAVEAGVAMLVTKNVDEAVAEAAKLVALLPANNIAAPAAFEFAAPTAALGKDADSAIAAIADEGSAVELYKDYGNAVKTALCTINGAVAGIVATNGPDTQLGNHCTIGAARFVRLCDTYSIPLVTVVNTGGFKVSSKADEAGAIRNAARLAATYADATTAKVAVLCGKAIGTAYNALANADVTVAVEGAVISPVEPTAAVTILKKEEIEASANIEAETAKLAAQYASEVASAASAVEVGLADMYATAATTRQSVAAALDILASKRVQRIAKKHGNMAL